MNWLRGSAAARIAFASALAFALATLAIGIVAWIAVHQAISLQIDASVRDATDSLLAEYRDDGAAGVREAIALRKSEKVETLGFALFDGAGRRIGGGLDVAMPQTGLHEITFVDPVEGPDPARALTTLLPRGERLVVAADLEPLEAIDEKLSLVFGIGFVVMLAIAALIALVLARYLSGRLEQIGRVATAFAAGDRNVRAGVGPRGDEFDRLARSLNAMLDRIDALIRNLRQVTGDLAHDLRTPLTRMRNQLEDLRTAPAPRREELIDRSIERSDELLALFGAILRIAEVEEGELGARFRQFDCGALLAEIAETYAPLAEDEGRTMTVSDCAECRIEGDRELIAQALINLVENALKHTPPGSSIALAIRTAGDRCAIAVSDNGPGIGNSDRARVTERFVRLEAARSTPGHGLGLALVKAVAEAHRGTLRLADNGPGLKAELDLPREQT